MSTFDVPKNQSLQWYKTALENGGQGNGGESKDYDIEQLEKMYYWKCSLEADKKNIELTKQACTIVEEVCSTVKIVTKLNLSLPIVNFDLLYDETLRIFLQIPKVIA